MKIFWGQNIHSWTWHDFLHLVVTLTVSNIEEIKLNITIMLRIKGLKDIEELQLQFKNVLVFWSHYQDSHNICKFSRTDWICILPKTSWFDPPPASAVKQPSKYCHNQLLETECQASGYGQDGGKNYSYRYEYIYTWYCCSVKNICCRIPWNQIECLILFFFVVCYHNHLDNCQALGPGLDWKTKD